MSERKQDGDPIGALLRSTLTEAPEAPFLERKIWNAIAHSGTSQNRTKPRLAWANVFSGVLGMACVLAFTLHFSSDPVEVAQIEEDSALFEITGLETEAGEAIALFYDNL